jgi:hypothetical protein
LAASPRFVERASPLCAGQDTERRAAAVRATLSGVFHVELRQFPHVTRAFNLQRGELDSRILGPWVRGNAIELDERRWLPDRAKLAVYEGRALAGDEIGMGRGWANVTRTGEEVTARVVAEARQAVQSPPVLETLKQGLLARSADGQVRLAQVFELIGELEPEPPERERPALAARAVWELLQEGRLTLSRPG